MFRVCLSVYSAETYTILHNIRTTMADGKYTTVQYSTHEARSTMDDRIA